MDNSEVQEAMVSMMALLHSKMNFAVGMIATVTRIIAQESVTDTKFRGLEDITDEDFKKLDGNIQDMLTSFGKQDAEINAMIAELVGDGILSGMEVKS